MIFFRLFDLVRQVFFRCHWTFAGVTNRLGLNPGKANLPNMGDRIFPSMRPSQISNFASGCMSAISCRVRFTVPSVFSFALPVLYSVICSVQPLVLSTDDGRRSLVFPFSFLTFVVFIGFFLSTAVRVPPYVPFSQWWSHFLNHLEIFSGVQGPCQRKLPRYLIAVLLARPLLFVAGKNFTRASVL